MLPSTEMGKPVVYGQGGRLALILVALAASACVGVPGDNPDAGMRPDADPLAPDAAPWADGAPPIELPDISFDHYHSQEEIAAYLRAVAAAAPGLVSFEVIGASELGREVAVVAINATGLADPPAMYANGTHHGDEKCGTETALALIDHLLRYRDDGEVSELLSGYAIYVQPLVNPDGHATDSRGDAYGRDPNRDYLIPGGVAEEAFQLVETRLVRDLHLRVGFRASIAYHGGTTGILWPWGFSYDETDDHDLMHTLAKICALASGIDRYFQSVELYPAEGEYSDWAYMADGTFSITFEIDDRKSPPTSQLPALVDDTVAGSVAFMDAVRRHDNGELVIEPESKVNFGIAGRTLIVNGEKRE